MGHIIISPVPALSRAVLVDQASVDPVYVQSSSSGGIRTRNLLNQLIVLNFDVEQNPHTLNIQILLARQKCMQFIIGIKITLH